MPSAELLQRLSIADPAEVPHLDEALTHPSFANEQRGKCSDNQRLEFLGDAVLGMVTSEALMARFPAANEGELSLMRSLLVNAEALAAFGRSIGLAAELRVGRGADSSGERDRDNVLADAVEAIVGALYLDLGLDRARALGARIVAEPLSRIGQAQAARDAKSELQEKVQAEGGSSPRYRIIRAEGPDHRRSFVVEVDVDGVVLAEGTGRSKKTAEQAAARAALDARERARLGDAAPPAPDAIVQEPSVSPAPPAPEPR
ncbi:MAG: ribonuclease III [Byssovorax sp.]